MSQRHIFLSYRSTEVDFALKLAASLKNAGVNLWMDRLDIRPGEDWRKALEDALHNSAAMIAVLSPGYVSSKYCQRELARVDRYGRAIFPVLLGQLTEEQLPLEIERQQHVDFSQWQHEATYNHQIKRLVDILKKKFAAQMDLVPDPETQYLTNLVARLESQKGITEYLEKSSEADKWLRQDFVRPEPRFVKSWVESSNFTVIEYTPTIGDANVLPIPGYKSTIRDIRTIASQYPRFVLVGEEGSGKTTTLQYLIQEAVHSRDVHRQNAPLPMYLNLATWGDDMTLRDFIVASWPLDTDPLKLLAKGDIVLYVDALNEIATERNQKVSMLRKWLASPRGPQQIVITCRRTEYTLDINLGLPVVQIGQMLTDHIHQFVTNYLGEEISPILINRILPKDDWEERHKLYLYQLARNPFLLSALILFHKSSPYGDVPDNKGALLRLLTAQMWQRTCAEKPVGHIAFEELERALAELAFAMIDEDMGVYAPEAYALEHMGSHDLLEAALDANFIQRRGGNIRFTYQAHQEYFAALSLRRLGLAARLPRPAVDPGGRYLPGKWDQVVIIHCCISSNADKHVLEIARNNPFLALECIIGGVDVSHRVVDPVIGALLQEAHTSASDARVATANILARLNPDLALPILLEATRDGNWEVRSAATISLWEMHFPTLEGLTGILQHSEQSTQAEMQEAVIIALRHLRDDALPTLLKLLRSEDWRMRRSACWALAELRDKAATPGLIQMLNDDVTMVSEEAAHALSKIKDEAAIPWLIETLQHSNRRIRRGAARALGNIGEPALDLLFKALRKGDVDARRLIIEAIKEIRQPVATRVLLKLSHDRSADVRAATLEALEDRMDDAVITRLIQCLEDDATARWNRTRISEIAARILESIRTPEAQIALEEWCMKKISKQSSENNGQSAAQARERLKRLSEARKKAEIEGQSLTSVQQPAKIIDHLLEKLRTTEWGAREDAAKSLREYTKTLRGSQTDRIVERLVEILGDDDWIMRWATAEALASLGNKKAVPALMKAVHDDNWMVRIAVVRGLMEFKDRKAVKALLELVGDESSLVREAVAEALGALGDTTVSTTLMALLADPEAFVRLSAMNAMGKISQVEASRYAIGALEDDDGHVRWAAAAILRDSCRPEAVETLVRHLDDEAGPHWEKIKIGDLAAAALRNIGTEEALEEVAKWERRRTAAAQTK